MKKILLAIILMMGTLWATPIKKATENISFFLTEPAGKPDSVHIYTYADNGTAAKFTNRSTTYPFSDAKIDTLKEWGDTSYVFTDAIANIDGAAGNFLLSVRVDLFATGLPTSTNYDVQVISDSLNYLGYVLAGRVASDSFVRYSDYRGLLDTMFFDSCTVLASPSNNSSQFKVSIANGTTDDFKGRPIWYYPTGRRFARVGIITHFDDSGFVYLGSPLPVGAPPTGAVLWMPKIRSGLEAFYSLDSGWDNRIRVTPGGFVVANLDSTLESDTLLFSAYLAAHGGAGGMSLADYIAWAHSDSGFYYADAFIDSVLSKDTTGLGGDPTIGGAIVAGGVGKLDTATLNIWAAGNLADASQPSTYINSLVADTGRVATHANNSSSEFSVTLGISPLITSVYVGDMISIHTSAGSFTRFIKEFHDSSWVVLDSAINSNPVGNAITIWNVRKGTEFTQAEADSVLDNFADAGKLFSYLQDIEDDSAGGGTDTTQIKALFNGYYDMLVRMNRIDSTFLYSLGVDRDGEGAFHTLHEKIGDGPATAILTQLALHKTLIDSTMKALGWPELTRGGFDITNNLHSKLGAFTGLSGVGGNAKDAIQNIALSGCAGFGSNTMRIYVKSGATYIQGASVTVRTPGGEVYPDIRTGPNGFASFSQDTGYFYITVVASGYIHSPSPDTFHFLGTNTDTIGVTAHDFSICNVTGDVADIFGVYVKGATVSAQLVSDSSNVKFGNINISGYDKRVNVKPDGTFTLPLIPNSLLNDSLSTYFVSIDVPRAGPIYKRFITVPNQGSYQIQ